jgi:ornithine carbamoyltransferase
VKARHVLSIMELGPENLSQLLSQAIEIARGRERKSRSLEGKAVGIYFRCSSTRTRTSFTVGAMRLGAGVVTYGPNDLQVVTGESIGDTARVLSGFLDALVIRTNGSLAEMKEFAAQGEMAIVNAMSDNEHPTQAIADLVTIHEALGHLEKTHILYIGEGNNTAASLAFAVAQLPAMRLTLITPEGYGLPDTVLESTQDFTRQSGSIIEQQYNLDKLPTGVDVVYTTRWETMGVSKADPNWRERFKPYAVTPNLMAAVSKPSGTIFLHDLPAMRGSEVLDEVLDGAQSVAFRQARHKLTSAMAVLDWCLAG